MTLPDAATVRGEGDRMLLGGLTPAAFLRVHWQRRSRLVRSAVPGFDGLLSRDALFALAQRDDVESRLVVRDGSRWSLEHGPFRRADLRALPQRNWTLLVQGVNLHDERADRLLRRFSFVPYARLDDLMISYAAPGGGVGAHFDSYDVFLLQGRGRRRWRWGRQRDLSLIEGRPLKILRHFTPQHDEVLGPGDMLYLPPNEAHDGIAVNACTTCSIGFRAPAARELAQGFLAHLQETVALDGRYADPGLAATHAPARIDASMVSQVERTLGRIRWTRDDVRAWLGASLTEPKAHVFFDPPAAPLGAAAFARAAGRRGVRLDRRTQVLYDDDALYVNGESRPWLATGRAALTRLANVRRLTGAQWRALPRGAAALLHDWYRDGFLHLDG